MELDKSLKVDFLSEIKGIIQQARTNAVRSVDFCRVQTVSYTHLRAHET